MRQRVCSNDNLGYEESRKKGKKMKLKDRMRSMNANTVRMFRTASHQNELNSDKQHLAKK